MLSYKLYNRQQYFDYLVQRYERATADDTIILATMEFRPDQPGIMKIVDALCTAAERGAHVVFIVDAYSFMVKEGVLSVGPLFFRRKDPNKGYGSFRPVVDAIQKMRTRGVRCAVINKPTRPFKNPFSGRSHIKYGVINDEVFIGGCNLSHPEMLDVMVYTESDRLANYLVAFSADVIAYKNVRKALHRRDKNFKIDSQTELLIDAGVKHQSLIYERAFNLINDAAQRVYMTCQYFPNNFTPAALAKAAYRGVNVHLAYNHPDQHRAPIKTIQKRTVAYKKKRLPESMFEKQLHQDKDYLHAKILLSEKEAIIGSHNFVKMGVDLGTAEIALHSTSKDFITAARKWVHALH